MFKIKKIYKRSLNFAFGVLIETRCIGQLPGPQLAGNKPRFVAYIIMSVFCSSEGWSTLDPNTSRNTMTNVEEDVRKQAYSVVGVEVVQSFWKIGYQFIESLKEVPSHSKYHQRKLSRINKFFCA
jgi:hypothetical protein